MSPPVVTVVVPALNAERWIAETLSSVVAQTHPKDALEIIVIDDGCTDGTIAEASRVLMASGIAHAVLHNESPLGPSASRNLGWRRARGEWIQFLDADDLLAPSKIEVQALTINAAESSVAAVFSPWSRLVRHGKSWISQSPWVSPVIGQDPLLDVLRDENFMQLSSVTFSRTWLDRVGGFVESYRLIEDVDLMIRLVIAGGVLREASSAQPLSWYRQRAGSLSRSNDRAFVDGCLRNARVAEQYWRERDMLTAERAAVLARVHLSGMRYYSEHDPRIFRSLERHIRRLNPDFVADDSRAVRLLSLVAGYRLAMRCAAQWRRLKRTVRTSAWEDL